MDSLLNKIYNLSESDRKDCEKHVMLGGGTPGPTMVRGQGVYLWDVDDNQYIDCTSQSWAMYLGFSNPEIIQVIKEHSECLTHIHQGFHTLTRLYLSREISRICPAGFTRVSFTPGGGPSIESAMKVALLNRPGAQTIFSQYDSYHGTTLGAMSASWHSTKASGKYVGGSHFLPLLQSIVRFPNPYLLRLPIPGKHEEPDVACAEVLNTLIERGTNGPPAGVIVEPLQASAGQIPATTAYLKRVREICDEHGALLIYDEIQTFCRIGRYTAAEHFGVEPDVIVFGKGLGGGLPLSCIVIRDGIEGLGPDVQELHTFASPTLSHVTSLKMLEIIARDAILERTREMGEYLRGRLEALKEDFPEIADVRQVGLHIGVEFARPDRDLTPLPNEVKRIRAEAMKRGCIFGLGGVRPWVLKVKPTLIISEEEADKVIAILCEAMTAVFGRSKVAVS
ncbi:MAG: aspartate aminotransferase family protein [Candidatus Omnitrophica bacterium]|nr:aspartate aminotransferase family protein [Candidatus Omnitrophota bacterium]